MADGTPRRTLAERAALVERITHEVRHRGCMTDATQVEFARCLRLFSDTQLREISGVLGRPPAPTA